MITQAPTIDQILTQALSGQALTPDAGVLLLEQTDPSAWSDIQQAADQMRQDLVGDTVTYVVNRNINFTNICEQHCNFCAFRRDADQEGAYWLTEAQILEKAADARQRGATEICMQGGLNLEAKLEGQSLPYYVRLVKTLKASFPEIHLHAFSPQEIEFIAREDRRSFTDVISALSEAGVDSMPGTAAEILDDQVRRVLCPEKIDTATWLEVVSAAHQLGVPTTSTMLSGHIETPAQQIGHLERLRSHQQKMQSQGNIGFSEFVLLPYVGQDAPPALRRRVGRDQPTLEEVLHLTAVARLFLGRWMVNHQPSWVKLGVQGAAQALQWGCNDIGGTLMEEHITTMAGAQGGTCLSESELQNAIKAIDRPYRQRTTLYGWVA
ncbi:FO synthase [Acaryochloris thomasi RCC1774]|uniref:5-amino-6-(D-ribitylamino)uracil--L-tyrosine 4-hydroxyphenyl transferase n=1 Tax=Acaryochloris thomasi RCC1774 TaxID=1764569 RepID=A0A2W1JMU0_9CYAN|nr:7,8-didemethyl-8-hydroxy-5-deazariboflavin synthase subunit CofH [Acaryochloris thomasi]PZD74599.1 FO synthase [Acaryochloris thomasi RCC1774]